MDINPNIERLRELAPILERGGGPDSVIFLRMTDVTLLGLKPGDENNEKDHVTIKRQWTEQDKTTGDIVTKSANRSILKVQAERLGNGIIPGCHVHVDTAREALALALGLSSVNEIPQIIPDRRMPDIQSPTREVASV